jgi:putative heme-binding domain-containing protein
LEALLFALGRHPARAEAHDDLRKIADLDPSQRDAVLRAIARDPVNEDWPLLVQGLGSPSPVVLAQCVQALRRLPSKPKADDPAPFRAALLATAKMEARDRWHAAELLRHWGGKKFTPEDGDWKAELGAWARWFAQTFPKEPSLPNVTALPVATKWKFDELLTYLEKDDAGRGGDVARGRAIFEKTNCLKCHKFGSAGEGLGPDLTTLKGRFTRADVLEAILYPSKVISDQYRGSVIVTKKGETITGLAAPQGDVITVLQLDGSKVTIKVADVDVQIASTTSPMPERLIDELTLQQIADLFAFLESAPH